MYTCLFANAGTGLRDPLRSGATDEELVDIVSSVWAARADQYSEERSGVPIGLPKVEMSYIGG
jgi:cyclic pyranopterin phosphate synthase